MMKINKIAGTLAFLAATALSSAASASNHSVGILDQQPLGYEHNMSNLFGPISETYNFTISAPSFTLTSSTVQNLGYGPEAIQTISGFNLSVYNSSNALLNSTTISGTTLEFSNLSAGSYYAVVSGSSAVPSGGAYTIQLYAEASPVPVPAAVWLLGSGLIGLVGVARRKEKA